MGWTVRRADDFAPREAAGNRALCGCCTCCCVCLVGGGLGLLAGLGTGIGFGIRAAIRNHRDQVSRGWRAFISAAAALVIAFPLTGAMGFPAAASLLLAALAAAAAGVVTGMDNPAAKVLGSIGLVIGYIVLLALIGGVVGFGIGLAIDKGMGTF